MFRGLTKGGNQGFSEQDYEVLVVNDGSTDGTEEIIDSFCQVPIFKKINKINGGVSSARNLGIEKASGEYITFVDADDKVTESIYAPIIDYMAKNKLEGYHFGTVRNEDALHHQLEPKDIEKYTQICDSNGLGGFHGTIYKKKILIEKQITFQTSMTNYEDLLFDFYYTRNTERKGYINFPLYYYRQNPESVTQKLLHNKNTYGNLNTPEYRVYLSSFVFLSKLLEYRKKHPRDPLCEHFISAITGEVLWFGMWCLYDPSVVLADVKKNGLSLKDIKRLRLKRNRKLSLKQKIKSRIRYFFKYPFIYKVASWIYRRLKK